MEQAELDGNIDPISIDDEVVERYIQCANHALPYFSSQVDSTKFLKFMCEKFLPLNTWNMIGATEQQDQMQLRLLKVFAEMCKFSGQLEKPSEKIEAIFNVLQVRVYEKCVFLYPLYYFDLSFSGVYAIATVRQ